MIEQPGAGPRPSSSASGRHAALAQRFLTHAFGWMFAGLLLTAGRRRGRPVVADA